ncbi:MAG: cytochrome c3 family protein, partial [Thermoanaerobaculia bacterium]|nr:cytochrome c3 family protein [Thermoanaerobaculia bacterium]
INLLIGMAVMLLAATFAFAHHGPDKVTWDDVADKQPAVTFDHAKHANELVDSCDTCHHTNKGLTAEDDKKVMPCTKCHLKKPMGDVGTMKDMSPKKNPMHIKCMGCHKENDGPTKCTECHQK